jgi:hypothetical protein
MLLYAIVFVLFIFPFLFWLRVSTTIIIMSSFFVCIFVHDKARIEFCMVLLLLLFHRSYLLTLFCCRRCCWFSCLDCLKFVFCLLLLLILFYKGKMLTCMDLEKVHNILLALQTKDATHTHTHTYIYTYIVS